MQSPNEFFKCSGGKNRASQKSFAAFGGERREGMKMRDTRTRQGTGRPLHPCCSRFSRSPATKKSATLTWRSFFAYAHTSIFCGRCSPGETECPGRRG